MFFLKSTFSIHNIKSRFSTSTPSLKSGTQREMIQSSTASSFTID